MFKNKWNENHRSYWNPQLELKSDGFSSFQSELIKQVKDLLNSSFIKYTENVSQHTDLNDKDKVVKMVTLTLTDFLESSLWIYHDMAEYNLNKSHHIYEEWGYLSPVELQEKYIESVIHILKIN